MKEQFCNLHCHTYFSALDGYGSPKRMAHRAAKLGQPALAITDHGSMSALIEVKQQCVEHNIKFIPGSEFYIAPWGRDVYWRPDDGKRTGTGQHLTVWAYNQTGYSNLLKLTEYANKVGFFHVPRIDYARLEQYSAGLIVTSGCMASGVCSSLNPETGVTSSDYMRVNKIFGFMRDVFGLDRYFIELQGHDIPALREINVELSRVNKHYNFQYLVTNDSHYAYPEDNVPQVDMMCIGQNCSRHNPNNFIQSAFVGKSYYMPSLQQAKSFDFGMPVPNTAFTNTVVVADMVEDIKLGYEPEVKQYRFPVMPEYEADYGEHLRKICVKGLKSIYGTENEEALERLMYELKVINDLEFASYFLCVYDIKQYCDRQAIPMTVRGSAGGSIVLHCLGITDFCPIEYNLIFERFLNPDRVSAPDADLDIDPSRRNEVMQYLIDKYGKAYAAQVVTFMYIKGRGAIRDATRILDHPFDVGSILSGKILDEIKGTVAATTDSNSPYYNPDFGITPLEREIIEVALGIEGQIRTSGIHAGALMLSDRPLVMDYPMVRPKGKSANVSELLVGYDYETAESVGGIKIDVLGVEALGIIYEAMRLINEAHDTDYRFENLPVADPASYELINSGNLAEIFQLSGYAARGSTAVIQPKNVMDVMVAASICRPGPNQYEQIYADRMHGVVETQYKHPDLEAPLKSTYGIMLFQESVMAVSQAIAGFTGGQADILRKAISKKKGFDKIKKMFITGAKERGHTDEFIESIWDDMVEFAGYGFNMAHACAYARIAVKQAYLKSKYTIEYYAAAMTGRARSEAKLDDLMKEMGKFDIKLLPPQLGRSDPTRFTIDYPENAIRYPYGSVKNVGKGGVALAKIKGLHSVDAITGQHLKLFKRAGKRALESLAFVGALDHLFNNDRNKAVQSVPYLSKGVAPVRQSSYIDTEEVQELYSEAEFLAFERELTGMYLTGHPMEKFNLTQPKFADTETYESMDDQAGIFVGVVRGIRPHRDSGGGLMAFVTIEDIEYSPMSVVVFSSLYREVHERICMGCVIKVLGVVNVRYGKTPEEDQKLQKYGRCSIVARNIIGEQ